MGILTRILADTWQIADPLFLDLVIDGLAFGANMCYDGPRTGKLVTPNYSSALDDHIFISETLKDEMSRGWTSHWFDRVPLSSPRIAPLGVTRRAASGKPRMIVDGSTGGSLALNEGILKLYTDFVKWDTIIAMFIAAINRARARRKTVVKVWLIKLDVVAAFRNIPIRPEDLHLQIIEWLGKFTVPLRMTFGARASPGVWERYGHLLSELFRLWLGHCSMGRRLPLRLYRDQG